MSVQFEPMAPCGNRRSAGANNIDKRILSFRVGHFDVLARRRSGNDVPESHVQWPVSALSSRSFTRHYAVLMEHMMRLRGGQRGQALLLVTLSLFAMCGLLGLAIDLGWSYFIQKSAQNAADSAALSAAHQALCGPGSSSSCGSPSAPGETVPITCGNVNCQPATACAPGNSNNLSSGCFFAQQNGFTPGGNGGPRTRDSVSRRDQRTSCA